MDFVIFVDMKKLTVLGVENSDETFFFDTATSEYVGAIRYNIHTYSYIVPEQN